MVIVGFTPEILPARSPTAMATTTHTREITAVRWRRRYPVHDTCDTATGGPLTMRLSGRAQTCPVRCERNIAKRARGAHPLTRHGPLEPFVRRRNRARALTKASHRKPTAPTTNAAAASTVASTGLMSCPAVPPMSPQQSAYAASFRGQRSSARISNGGARRSAERSATTEAATKPIRAATTPIAQKLSRHSVMA
jgi:hypothetical protein